MRYKVGVVKKITFLFMTIGLAVALVACEGAVGKTGEPGPKGEPGDPAPPAAPVNLAPVARALTLDSVMLVEEGEAKTVNVATNFYDPEGKALTLTHSVEPAEGIVGVGLADGALTITPVARGDATITVTATDDGDLSASATIAVTVAPEGMMPPMYVADSLPASVALMPGAQHVIAGSDIAAAFQEDEGESLTFGASGSDDTIVMVTQAVDNTVTITALAMTGDATVTITATDEDSLTAEHAIAVSVRATLQPEASDMTPGAVALSVGGAAATVDVSMYFVDPNVGDLMYEASSSDDTKATASADGSMVTITPVAAGMATVMVTASNAHGSATQMISVTVAATPPTAVGSISDVTLMSGQARSVGLAQYFAPGATGDTLTYSVSGANSMVGARVLGDTLLIEALSVGSATITVTATDADGETAMQTVMVTVEAEEVVEPPPANMAPQPKAGMMLSDLRIEKIDEGANQETGKTDLTDNDTRASATDAGDAADNKSIDLSKYFEDPDGPLLFYTVTKTETPDDSDMKPVIDLHSVAATTGAAASGAAPDGTDVSESIVVIEPRNTGSATVMVTVTDVDGDAITEEFVVTVVASGTNDDPAIGSEATSDTAIPDLVGAADTDPSNGNFQRLKIGETRKAFDGNISVLFSDADFMKPDRPNEMLTLSVKYFPVGTTTIDGVAINTNTVEELAADKVGVSHTLSTTTWNGSSSAKLTLSLTGTMGTPLGADDIAETDDGNLVALIATDEYGRAFAHVLQVIVNHVPKAEGAQAEDPKTLGTEMGHMDLAFDSVTATNNATRVVLVEDDGGYFHDPDGATDSITCRIKGTTGTSGDNPAFKFTLQNEAGDTADPRGLRIETLKAQGTGSVTIACLDAYGESSPDATLSVKATHQSVSRH